MTLFMQWLDMHPLFWPLFIFTARILDVSIGTLRTIFVIRGSHVLAPLLGFIEVIIWVLAITGVLTHLDHWYNILAYAAGFATGNAVGILMEKKLAIGMQAIRLISCTRSAAVASGLRLAGYRVTEVKGHGYKSEISLSFVVVPRRDTPMVLKVAQSIDPEVFSTVEDIRSTNLHDYRSPVPPTGWRSIFKRK
ncbi:MAG: DUF2179 domain-containing protein [Planctomycetota bacterium]|nr:MAG: DUF2179 domain-containing protein [Planctomycetota bacterium]